MKKILSFLTAITFHFAAAGDACACGPDFENAYLVRGVKENFLSVPRADFYKEMAKLIGSADEYNQDAEFRKRLGWQARDEYKNGDFISSIRHYLEIKDVDSLYIVSRILTGSDQETVNNAMRDSLVRQVVLAWAVSKESTDYMLENEDEKERFGKILNAVEQISGDEDISTADKIAWIYYNSGDFENTIRWLELAEKDSPVTIWIEAKLLIMDGDIDSAIDKLKQLLPYFKDSDTDQVKKEIYSEIGVLALGREDYLFAFDMLIKGRYWEDIAYMAEKVLSADELEAYIGGHSKESLGYNNSDYGPGMSSIGDNLRYLLARRYMRMEMWQKAMEIMPDAIEVLEYEDYECQNIIGKRYDSLVGIKEKMREYYDFLTAAENKDLPSPAMAKNYFDAAVIMREYGMEISGTELDPDWFYYGGSFYVGDCLENRFALTSNSYTMEIFYLTKEWKSEWYMRNLVDLSKRRREIKMYRDFFTGSQDEENRVLVSMPRIQQRFHYRYVAAELMWKCASLLPDNDPLLVRALYEGGCFLKDRDPKAADKFYKELVNRNKETEFGKLADKKRWFPSRSEFDFS